MPGTANSGGRNRKSAADHRLEGTFQKVRHAGVGTPEPPKGRPEPPKPLVGDAIEEWDRMVDRLELSGSLSVVDDAALYQYCQLFAETERLAVTGLALEQNIDQVSDAMRELKEGELVRAIQELTKLRQLEASNSTKVRQGRMAIRQYLVEFGMTPSARTRVKLPEAPDAGDPFSEFEATH